jgi:hypothetical protein
MVEKFMDSFKRNARVGLWKPFLTRFLLSILVLIPQVTQAQIKVDKAGDGWDLKIDSAITLIKQIDTNYYSVLVKHCQRVEIWNEKFSSNEWVNNSGTILVSVNDIKLNSINNLAAVLVHESAHLRFRKWNRVISEEDEERFCYGYELYFLNLIPNVEPWLLDHTFRLSRKK